MGLFGMGSDNNTGGQGPAAAGVQAPGQTGGQGPGNESTGPNGGTGDAAGTTQDNLDPWAKPANLNSEGAPGSQNNSDSGTTAPDQQQQQQPGGPDAFANFVNSINFTEGVELGDAITQFNDGKPEALQTALNSIGANAFKQSMVMANRLMDKRIDSAVEEAVTKATGKVNSNLAFDKLANSLPFTKEDSVSPVAQAVMTGFLRQNQDVDTAIQNTGKYFEKMLRDAAADLGVIPGVTGDGGGPGNPRNADTGRYEGYGSTNKAPDWFDIL